MKVTPTAIPDVLILEPKVFGDHRGYFMESFNKNIFKNFIGDVEFVQDNESMSEYGVLRGLHYQKPPYAQSKLVRVIEGEVLDVVVDIRSNSATYGEHVAVKLSAENKKQLWVPKGFAHGFVVLSPKVIFSYKCDAFYAPEHDAGIAFDDPSLGIDWQLPKEVLQLSEKDTNQNQLFEAIDQYSIEEYNQKQFV